ncbi:MAG: fatty acid desaturase [Bacteroidia bacterium]
MNTPSAYKNKALILATKNFTDENTLLSWFYTLSTMLLLIVAFAGAVWNIHPLAQLACGILAGFLNVRMFVIYHDHQHGAILRRSKTADLLFKLYGLFTLAPSSIWKRSHDYHHKHNSKLFSASIGSYPIMTRKKFLESSPAERRSYLFTRHPMTIGFGYIFMFLIGMCLNSFKSSPSRHWDSLVAILLHVAVYIAVYFFGGITAVLCGVLIPSLIAFAIGAYLFYAQHNFPGVQFADNNGWTYEGAAMESSSFMKLNPVMNWFTANIGYHHIHHLNARIPFYRLPEAFRTMPELQDAKTTSMSISDIISCFRLKVWDSEKGKMISMKELYA